MRPYLYPPLAWFPLDNTQQQHGHVNLFFTKDFGFALSTTNY